MCTNQFLSGDEAGRFGKRRVGTGGAASLSGGTVAKFSVVAGGEKWYNEHKSNIEMRRRPTKTAPEETKHEWPNTLCKRSSAKATECGGAQ